MDFFFLQNPLFGHVNFSGGEWLRWCSENTPHAPSLHSPASLLLEWSCVNSSCQQTVSRSPPCHFLAEPFKRPHANSIFFLWVKNLNAHVYMVVSQSKEKLGPCVTRWRQPLPTHIEHSVNKEKKSVMLSY